MDFMPEGPMAIPMWLNGHAFMTAGQGFLDVVNPVSGEAIRRVPLCGADEASEAQAAARAAQSGWAALDVGARREALAALATALDNYTGHFAKLMAQESGAENEVERAQVEAAVAALRGDSLGEGGVFGLVLDASQPLLAFARAMAPAMLAGATLVVKPSPKAPSAVFALCELATRAQWPNGVLNLLQGDTAAVEGLCASGVDRLVYVGNAALGEQVGRMAAAAGVAFVAA
ncbi:MAG: aldehyde dehydrogenase family protein [Rhodocyclales bacterium]|nr:aldehyde dehydrogenase family protein [Rhodocyclales bacterium]